jgi:hypothetical protein
MSTLPTARDLTTLSLRGICAYSVSCARRLSSSLRDVLPSEIIEQALQLAEKVAQQEIDPFDAVRAPRAAAAIADAISRASATREQHCAALALIRTADVAYSVVQGALNENRRSYYHDRAATFAVRIAHTLERIDKDGVPLALNYYVHIRKMCGTQQLSALGAPIDLARLE